MIDYNNLSTYEKEEYIAIETLKYLQKFLQPVTRGQITDYLVKNNLIPKDALLPVKSKNGNEYIPFTQRLSFGISSLYKSNLIAHPKHGITEITELGKKVDTGDTEYLHNLFVEGWENINETTSSPNKR